MDTFFYLQLVKLEVLKRDTVLEFILLRTKVVSYFFFFDKYRYLTCRPTKHMPVVGSKNKDTLSF
jgi:hypothetical protein